MTTDLTDRLAANKDVVRRGIELFNRRGDFSEVWAPDVVWHAAGIGEIHGFDAFREALGGFFDAFPDFEISVEDLIAEGDRVVGRYTTRATHTGEFMGLPATGRPVQWTGIDVYRIDDCMIAEEWFCEDLLSVLRQIGALPGTERAPDAR